MKQTWRWFGPKDSVTLSDISQTGASGIVTALHHIPTGEIWSPKEISDRKSAIEIHPDGHPTGLAWDVIESLPISEDIKKQSGDWKHHIDNYRQSMRNIAAAGIQVICYNFMPILDWTRTDLAWPLPSGATCMRFDFVDFAAFDLYILKRAGAEFPQDITQLASRRFAEMDEKTRERLASNVVFGLPGAAESFSLDDVRTLLAQYASVSKEQLRRNLAAFLEQVIPLAQDLGLRLCCHPDDPPFDLLGLPRIMSAEEDYQALLQMVDLPANGITLCSGSLGVRPGNDLPGMMSRLGDRVHFLHLRNVRREGKQFPGSFHESEHLVGDVDMIALIDAVIGEEQKRKAAGRADHIIPMRPDHGHDIVDDLNRQSQPGYPLVGRLRGLAELRGVEMALRTRR